MQLKLDIHPRDLEEMLRDAKEAHTRYEAQHPERDHSNWQAWYAGFIFQRLDKLAFEQWAEKRAVYEETRKCGVEPCPAPVETSVTDLVRAVGKLATGPTEG